MHHPMHMLGVWQFDNDNPTHPAARRRSARAATVDTFGRPSCAVSVSRVLGRSTPEGFSAGSDLASAR